MILWILALHIAALLLWCAALLYLPVLMLGIAGRRLDPHTAPQPIDTVQRLVFTRIATPAALVAIMSGTLVFLLNRTIDGWLIAKLTLVVGLVVCHTLTGLQVLKATSSDGEPDSEQPVDGKPATLRCVLLEAVQGMLIIAILWTVLAKPAVVPVP